MRSPSTRQIRQKLRQSEELYRRLFAAESDAIFLVDRETGRFVDANPAAERMYGYSRDEFLSLGVADVSAESDKSLQAIQAGEAAVALRWHRRRDGTVFPVEIAGGYLEGSGRRMHVAAVRDLTERKRMEEALRASEDRYRQLFDHMPTGVAVYRALNDGTDFVFVDFNRAGERMDNDSRELLIGKRLTEARPAVRDFGLLEALRRVWKTGVAEHFPVRLYQDTQLRGWYDNYIYRLPSGELVVIFDNVTERKRVEQRLAADLEAMSWLQRIGTLFVREGNLVSVLDSVVEAAIAITGADFGHSQLLDPATGTLRIVAQRGFPPWWLDYWNEAARAPGACDTAQERGERVIVEDLERSPIFAGTPGLEPNLRAGVRAVQSTPLMGRAGELLGVLSTHYRTPRRPEDRALHFLDLLARQAADLVQRVQSELALRESNERFRVALATAPIVVFNHDRDLRYTWIGNPTLGLRAEEALGRTDEQLLGADAAMPLLAIKRRVLETGKGERQEVRVTYAGQSGWFDLMVEPLRDATCQIVGITCVAVDITQRKAAEHALRESQEQFRTLVEQAPEGIFVQTRHRFAYLNSEFVRLLGASNPEQLLGEPVESRIHPDFRAQVRERIRLLNNELSPVPLADEVLLALDGSPRQVSVSAVPFKYNGEQGALVFVRDITERRRLETERAAALARLAVVEEEERRRFARELHDQVAQRLVALAVDLKRLRTDLAAGRSQLESVDSLRHAVDDLQREVRQMAWDLRTQEQVQGGLESALHEYVGDWSERVGVPVDYASRGLRDLRMPASLEAALYRVAQEALANVEKHARAHRVSVLLEREDTLVRLTVEDDGRGFDVDAVQQSLPTSRRLGLLGMQERVILAGGTFLIESSPGVGTTLLVRIPIPTETLPS